MSPKLEMTDEKLVLLYRSALIDDASNVNERLAVLKADITVDDDEIWVSISDELWPEDKETPNADAVAQSFMLEVEWSGSIGDFPFAWPGIGEHTNRTTEYIKLVMDAYAGRLGK